MHFLYSAPASPPLRGFVRAYAQRIVTPGDEEYVQPVPSSLESILHFELGEPLEIEYEDGLRGNSYPIALVGPHTRHGIHLHFNRRRLEAFAIFFQPLGLWQLFRIPPAEFPDRWYHGEDMFGRAVGELYEQLAECRSFGARVSAAERFLLRRACGAAGQTTIQRCATHLFRTGSSMGISELAHQSGLSLRHFERRFTAEIGIAPKLFSRISRFQRALDTRLHVPRRSWFAIAHDCGYHDQMHMIHEFEALAGASPNRLLAQLGDTRPPALAAAEREGDAVQACT
jgi:AraC-like DNA-binding protein